MGDPGQAKRSLFSSDTPVETFLVDLVDFISHNRE